ncbi:MAG: hypothetical protein LKJ88_07920 [Bacilli bacterium]|jgi:hypothetical protein|nr:hypothetical protein [Bacilli bacterium]
MLKHRKTFLALLATFLTASTCAAVGLSIKHGEEVIKSQSGKSMVNFTLDPDYVTICDTTPNLRTVEDENNMIPTNCYTYSTGQVVSTKSIMLGEGTYTFAIFVSDDTALLAAGAGANKIVMHCSEAMQGAPYVFTVEDALPASCKPSALFPSTSTNLSLRRFNGGMGCLFITVTFPTVTNSQGIITINDFDFTFNANKDCGKVTGFQLFKGDYTNFHGYSAFDHEPCGLSSEIEGPYSDGQVIRLAVPYGTSSLTESSIKSAVQAYDTGDMKYVYVNVVKNDYTKNLSVLNKDLDIVMAATDSSGNVAQLCFRITIFDHTKPGIRQMTDVRVPYTASVTEESILSHFAISDNYLPTNPTIAVKNFDFTASHIMIGEVPFTVEATDISGNVQTQESKVIYYDNVPPEITGPDQISAKSGVALSEAAILQEYTISDTIDKNNCTVSIKDNGYTGKESKPGVYSLIVDAVDKSGNETTKTVLMSVTDKDGPVFYVNKTTITTFGTQTISSEALLKSLIRNQVMPEKRYTYSEYVGGDYPFQDGKVDPGSYQAVLAAYASDGTTEMAEVTINVEEEVAQEYSAWDEFCIFFANIFKAISGFFREII